MSDFILGLDTTGSRLNMGLSNFADIHRVESLPLGKALSTDLHDCLQQFMEPQSWQSLSAIAIIVGPGSYTGSRIGVVTARTIAQSLNIPIYGFTSLAIAAAISGEKPGKVAISIPAQRNHIYGAVYELSDELEPVCLAPEKNQKLEQWTDFIQTYPDSLSEIHFEYSEENSRQMMDDLMQKGKLRLHNAVKGDWQNIFPNYAKP